MSCHDADDLFSIPLLRDSKSTHTIRYNETHSSPPQKAASPDDDERAQLAIDEVNQWKPNNFYSSQAEPKRSLSSQIPPPALPPHPKCSPGANVI